MSTLKRALRDLEGLRLITTTEERWAHDGRRNLYRLAGVHTGWVPRPRDMKQKPSVVAAAYKLIEERDAWISELEEQLTGFGWSKGNELTTTPVVEGQISTGQFDPTEEEEELSGQNEFDGKSSSSSPRLSDQADVGEPKIGVNMKPIDSAEQPELSVVTFEAVDLPSPEKIEEWVTTNWKHTDWRSLGAALFKYRVDPAQFVIDRMAYEEQWRVEDEARALSEVPVAPDVPEMLSEPVPPPPVVDAEPAAWELWAQVTAALHAELPRPTFDTWIANTFGVSIGEGPPKVHRGGLPDCLCRDLVGKADVRRRSPDPAEGFQRSY